MDHVVKFRHCALHVDQAETGLQLTKVQFKWTSVEHVDCHCTLNRWCDGVMQSLPAAVANWSAHSSTPPPNKRYKRYLGHVL